MSLPPNITQTNVTSVTNALQSPQWEWRTVNGVSTDTGLSEEIVRKIIRYLISTGDVIQSEVDSEDGRKLYTTRKHYEGKASLWDRVKAAFRNRADG